MRLVSLLALVGLGTLASGCIIVGGESTSTRGCGLVAGDTPDLNPDVTVLDEAGNQLCDARVVVRDGAFEQVLFRTSPSDCNHFEMPERPGFYEVTIERENYETFVARNVAVRGAPSSCLGPSAGLVVRLQRAEGCEISPRMSFEVDVRDEKGAPVCEVGIFVRDGEFLETLRPVPAGDGTCTWVGPVERPGTYEVTISKVGYEAIVLPSVVVTKGASDCHVTPAKIDATLVPLPPFNCSDMPTIPFVLAVFDELGEQVCDGAMTVRDGAFEEVVAAPEGACYWHGPYGRSGIYDITFSRPGYLPVVLEDVVAPSEVCHETVVLETTLTPEGPAPAGG